MHTTESTDQGNSEAHDGYDDCGIAITTLTNNLDLDDLYPTDFTHFFNSLYQHTTESISSIISPHNGINVAAAAVGQDADQIEADATISNCNITITEGIRDLLTSTLQFAFLQAKQLSELAFPVMKLDEVKEQTTNENIAELEGHFEEVAAAEVIEREISLLDYHAKEKLTLG